MFKIAVELAHHDKGVMLLFCIFKFISFFFQAYEDIASKFFEHFIHISDAINQFGGCGLWDTDFYYDKVRKFVIVLFFFLYSIFFSPKRSDFPAEKLCLSSNLFFFKKLLKKKIISLLLKEFDRMSVLFLCSVSSTFLQQTWEKCLDCKSEVSGFSKITQSLQRRFVSTQRHTMGMITRTPTRALLHLLKPTCFNWPFLRQTGSRLC